ncbi:MAG: type II toxin-antitoxin system Phd/YefM family antitoxin [Sphingomonadales bacterium]
MSVISFTEAREKLASVMDQACDDRAPVIITRQKKPSMVLLSLAEYEAMQETLHLLRSPRNAERLMQSVDAAERGDLAERPLAEPE